MLYVFLALALLSGCALTYAASGFASLAAVWQVPVFFLGSFLALVVLFLLVVLVSCLFVDPKAAGKAERLFPVPPQRVLPHCAGTGRCPCQCDGTGKGPAQRPLPAGQQPPVRVRPHRVFTPSCRGRSWRSCPKKREFFRSLLSHRSCARYSACRSTGTTTANRSSLFSRPSSSSRTTRPPSPYSRRAGRTKTGAPLLPYRSGVFKIAQKANVPIVVCSLVNSRAILHNMFRKHTEVWLDVLDVVPAGGAGRKNGH